jgi:carbonic anhydrase
MIAKRELLKLLVGFRKFRERYFLQESPLFNRLSTAGLFIVRNVANLVPPYEPPGHGFHGISSAIEFAVMNLKVENIVVLGHRQCGGIRALMTGGAPDPNSFIGHWMQIAEPAKKQVLDKFPNADDDTKCRSCEMASIGISLKNLRTFPFVQKAIEERQLTLVGAYFDLEQGQIFEYIEDLDEFKAIEV